MAAHRTLLRPDRREPAQLVPARAARRRPARAARASPSATPTRRAAGAGAIPALRRCSLAGVSGIGTYFAGDTLVLPRARRARSTPRRCAAAPERRPRDRDRREHPDAQGLRHRRHGAQRLRHRPRPEARVGGDHDRAPREARPRGAAGRHRPRAVARPQLRHPLLADRRRHGRRDRAPRRLLPALHVLGRRTGRRASATSSSGGGAPGDRRSSSRSSSRSSRRSSAGSSSSRSAASASTSPMRRRSS